MEKCVLCNDDIKPLWYGWAQGHNAYPIAEGRCCDPCNWGLVIPVRIKKWKNSGSPGFGTEEWETYKSDLKK